MELDVSGRALAIQPHFVVFHASGAGTRPARREAGRGVLQHVTARAGRVLGGFVMNRVCASLELTLSSNCSNSAIPVSTLLSLSRVESPPPNGPGNPNHLETFYP